MRYKPLLILLILFAFICGISSASASDLSNDTDMETYSAEITGINNENQSILTDTGNTVYANNWNELKTYCEKSDKNYIIHLKENTNFYPDNGTDYSQQIIVKNNVTIIGSEGSYFGDTNPNPISIYYTPIVTEDDSKISLKILNTTFKWMDLEKNIPAESGMFIQMGGNSKDNLLENSTFYNINSGTGHGCVYYLKRGYATVKNCSFKNITTEFGVLSIYDPAEDPTKNCTTAGMLVENCYFEDEGAFTGETSPKALKEMGVDYKFHILQKPCILVGWSNTYSRWSKYNNIQLQLHRQCGRLERWSIIHLQLLTNLQHNIYRQQLYNQQWWRSNWSM